MQFNSLEFLVFFLVVVTAYFAMPVRRRWILLLAASYWFYMAWRPVYALLIVTSTLIDYTAAILMSRTSRPAVRKRCLILSLTGNFGLLFAFKYFNFFSESLDRLLAITGLSIELPFLDVLLPVGISFYTFQTVSYTIEVYRGRQEPERHLGRFALYVAFFPQLVAGPIERPQNLLPQLATRHDFDYDRIRNGLILMLWGMFKKVVIADRLGVIVDHIYGNPERYPGLILTIGTVFFAFQIYCDFSGYSDIAIGAARILGIKLMRNFDRPYAARSIPDFWHRWHISLSTWFRDYLYLPLGGRRVPVARWLFNILVVFTVSGLWHGANWTFVIWGALHGSYYILDWLTAGARARLARVTGLARFPRIHGAIQIAITFVLTTLAWVFFRADTLEQALYILAHLGQGWGNLAAYGGFGRIVASMDMSLAAFAVSGFSIVALLLAEKIHGEIPFDEFVAVRPQWMRWSFYVAAGMAIMNLGIAEEIPFVYFQF